jgi:3-oxoacyl-[acyl-carrier protein] reductase
VNLDAVTNIDAEFIRQGLLGSGSKVVCLSSTNGLAGAFGQTNYAASKAGLVEYVKYATQQFTRDKGICFNAVAPGFIETRMTARMPFFARNVGRRLNAFFQPGYPIDIAEALLFFSSPLSDGLNGVTLRVCGGLAVGR